MDYIHKYLSRHYKLRTTQEQTKKLTIVVIWGIYHNNGSIAKREIRNDDILKDISTIFGISTKKAKIIINQWAKSINVHINLKQYWAKSPLWFPIIEKIAARTLGMDLVAVQPMSQPTGLLNFIPEYNVTGNTNARTYDRNIMIQQMMENQSKVLVNDTPPDDWPNRQSWFNPIEKNKKIRKT